MAGDVAPPLSEGRYRLVGVLGQGGAATVYRAFLPEKDVFVAVRVLSADLAERPEAKDRFLQGAFVAAGLKHPNIAEVWEFGDEDGRVWMATELVQCASLEERHSVGGPVPPRLAVAAMLDVLDGLGAIHGAGALHTRLCPRSVLVTPDGRCKLTDIGQRGIRRADDLGSYAPPEGSASIAGDVYAAGCTLYALLTDRDPADLHREELHGKLFAPIPEALRPILARATHYKPEGRYPSAAALREALVATIASLPADPKDTPPLALPLDDESTLVPFDDSGIRLGAEVLPPSDRVVPDGGLPGKVVALNPASPPRETPSGFYEAGIPVEMSTEVPKHITAPQPAVSPGPAPTGRSPLAIGALFAVVVLGSLLVGATLYAVTR